MRTRIKVCGITRPSDAELAVSLGVDAIGMIFYPGSPRNVSLEQAKEICSVIPAFVSRIGVFVNEQANLIKQTATSCGFSAVQLHGDEASEFAESLELPYIKVLTSKESPGLENGDLGYRSALGFLLDARTENAYGGTGQLFDRSAWPAKADKPLILAGGLGPDNVSEAIGALRPYAVDLNSGVESQPGQKDADKLERAIHEIRRADRTDHS